MGPDADAVYPLGRSPGESDRLRRHAEELVPQHRFLDGRGEQSVPGHTNILSTTPDISGEVKRRVLPALNTGISTPRS